MLGSLRMSWTGRSDLSSLYGAKHVIDSSASVRRELLPYGLARSGVSPKGDNNYRADRHRLFYDIRDGGSERCSKVERPDLVERFSRRQQSDLLLVSV
jgi:hypothetical protein